MRTARSRSAAADRLPSRRPGCASAAIGFRAAASLSTCSGRPVFRRGVVAARPVRCALSRPRLIHDRCGCRAERAHPRPGHRARFLGGAFASAETDPRLDQDFAAFIADGRHGDMEWLARTPERRTSPQGLWPEAKSIIVLGDNTDPPPIHVRALKIRRAVRSASMRAAAIITM